MCSSDLWDKTEGRPRVFLRRKLDGDGCRSTIMLELHVGLNDAGRIERPDMVMLLGFLGVELPSSRSRV